MEQVEVHARSGEQAVGKAEVQRFTDSEKLARAVPIGVGGTVVGLCTIVIPGVHLISVWAIPLLSIVVASYYYNRKGSLGEVEVACPACNADTRCEGGAWEEPMWVRCGACNAPLEVRLEKPM